MDSIKLGTFLFQDISNQKFLLMNLLIKVSFEEWYHETFHKNCNFCSNFENYVKLLVRSYLILMEKCMEL